MGLPEFLHKIEEETEEVEDAETIPYSTLSELSGIDKSDAQELTEYLNFWNPEQIRDLYARLTSLIEGDLQMEFDSIFIEGLDSDDDVTRSLSVTGLAESTHQSLLRILLRMLRNDDSEDVRIAAALGLARIATLAHEDKVPPRQAVDLQAMLIESFNDELETSDVRRRALEALAIFQGEAIEAYIEIAYEEGEDDEEEEDPRERLVRRLIEYQRYKEASEELRLRPWLGRDVYVRPAADVDPADRPLARDIDAFALLESFYATLEAHAEGEPVHEVQLEEFSFTERVEWLLKYLDGGEPLPLRQVLEQVGGRAQRVLTFLALLETTRLGMTIIEQEGHLGPVAVASVVVAAKADLSNLPKEEAG